MSPDARGDRLVRVAGWGRQSVHEAAEGHGAELVFEIDVTATGDSDAALALATRWQRARHQGVMVLRHASASSDRRGIRLCWEAPAGSTLDEVCGRAGPLAEAIVAALAVDLASAVAHAHARDLVVGRLTPHDVFVAPPGSDGIAALRVLGAGLPGLLEAAGQEVGPVGARGFAMLYEAPGYLAPEVVAGRAPTAMSDCFALCATLARALLGRPVFDALDERLLLHAQQRGPDAETAAALRKCAPALAAPLLVGLSPGPLQRAGALGDLRAALLSVLGEEGAARISIVRGGGPWEMGSPIVPLAAWAGTGAFADRFVAVRELAPTIVRDDPVAQARLDAALQQLDVQRAVARDRPRRSRVVDLVVLLVVAAIAATVVWIGSRRRDAARAELPARANAPWNQPPKVRVPGSRSIGRWPPANDRGR